MLFEEAGLTLGDTGFEVAEIDALVIDYEDGEGTADEEVDPASRTRRLPPAR